MAWELTLALFFCGIATSAATDVVVFGDSLSDIGNTLRDFQAPPEPYYKGRWTNGPAWPDYLAEYGNFTLTNYAYGGAASGGTPPAANSLRPGNATSQQNLVIVPDFPHQVAAYLQNKTASSNINCTIFIISIGGNDLIYLAKVPPSEATKQISWIAGNITAQVAALGAAGAKNILLISVPDPTSIPLLSGVSKSDISSVQLAVNFIQAYILAGLQEVPALCNCSANISTWDSNAFQTKQLANYTALGYNTTAACYTDVGFPSYNPYTVCASPETHYFWDPVHPVTQIHARLASDLMSTLKQDFSDAFTGQCAARKTGFSATAVPVLSSSTL